jgi:hypothetical protein
LREGLKWKARSPKVAFLPVVPATKEAEHNPTKTNLWARTCNEKPDPCGHAKVIKKPFMANYNIKYFVCLKKTISHKWLKIHTYG